MSLEAFIQVLILVFLLVLILVKVRRIEKFGSSEEYQINTACYNCNDRDTYLVPISMKSKDFLSDKVCKKCQVKGELVKWG